MGHNFLFYYAVLGLIFPFLSPVLLDAGYSKQAIGLIQSGTFVCATITPILIGRLSDKYFSADGLIRVLSMGMLIASGIMWWQSESPWVFLVVLMLYSGIRGPLIPLQDTLAMNAADNDARRYARFRLMAPIGFGVCNLGAGYVLGWRGLGAFFPLLMTIGAALFVSSLFLPRQEKQNQVAREEGFWRDINASYCIWLTSLTLHFVCFGCYLYGFTLLLLDKGVDHKVAGIIWSLGGPAEILVLLFSGWLFGRFKTRSLLLFALGCHLVRWSLVGLFPDPWLIAITQVLHGPGFSLFYVAVLQELHGYNKGRFQASYQGLTATAIHGVGPILGMTLAGVLAGYVSFENMFLWFLPIQVLSITLYFLFPLKPPNRNS